MREEDRLCVLQFIHPGGEHQPDDGDVKYWNEAPHRRKFMKSAGGYVTGKTPKNGDIVFWGEWEPESRVVTRYAPEHPDMPAYLYEPYFVDHGDHGWRQNTDPFVFGSEFLYTGCMQHTKNGPAQLRYLAPGSLILFGSCRERSRFVIDTVFVVRDAIEHSAANWPEHLTGRISATYQKVTIEPWYRGHVPPDHSHRMYRGATTSHPVGGMFSFFPCKPCRVRDQGFARPEIDRDNYVTPQLTQGKRITKDVTLAEVTRVWLSVVKQVKEQGLALGTYARLPLQRRRGGKYPLVERNSAGRSNC